MIADNVPARGRSGFRDSNDLELPLIVGCLVLLAGALLVLHGLISTVGGVLWVMSEVTREPIVAPFEIPRASDTPTALVLGLIGLALAIAEFLLGLRVIAGSRTAWFIGFCLGALPAVLYVQPTLNLGDEIVASLPSWRWLFVLPFAYVSVVLLAALLIERWIIWTRGSAAAREESARAD